MDRETGLAGRHCPSYTYTMCCLECLSLPRTVLLCGQADVFWYSKSLLVLGRVGGGDVKGSRHANTFTQTDTRDEEGLYSKACDEYDYVHKEKGCKGRNNPFHRFKVLILDEHLFMQKSN